MLMLKKKTQQMYQEAGMAKQGIQGRAIQKKMYTGGGSYDRL